MATERKTLKIFIHPVEGAGNINACVGLGQALAKRGHEVHFVAGISFKGQFTKYGCFKESLLESKQKLAPVSDDNPMKNLVECIETSGMLSNSEPIEKVKSCVNNSVINELIDKMTEQDGPLKKLIEQERPDLIVVGNMIVEPAIVNGTIPWVLLWSGNPLTLHNANKQSPPCLLGLPTNGDQTSWEQSQKMITSPYLNLYGYPQELDYCDVVPKSKNLVQVDAFCRKECEPFQLPEEFKQKMKPDDKLIYLSMGSMGGIDVDLMKKLVSVLTKTRHKYIVSKGPLHDKYELPDNMWGEAYLPQTSIIPTVDLVITHGGNNTVTETFNFGKPMIVMPRFADQYDNAQRVQEKGFGFRINPYEFEENVLIESIDKLLFDTELNQRLQAISKRIEQSNSKEKACIAIEQMVHSFKAGHNVKLN